MYNIYMTELQIATSIISTLKDYGHTAYIAGGAVRDMKFGTHPSDIDIATSAKPSEIEHIFKKTVPIGKAFGVINVIENGYSFEVSTFRTDIEYEDGRRPSSISFSTAEKDAQRRDFTINGLFYDPMTDETLDYVNGIEDLLERRIRFIGNPEERIKEDKLRLLRAIRFAVKLGFSIEEETWKAICDNSLEIMTVSKERIRDELVKLFSYHQPRRALTLLRESGILFVVLAEIEVMFTCRQNKKFHPEIWVSEHTIQVMEALPKDSSTELIWAALLHDVGKPSTTKIIDGVITSKRHAHVGAEITEDILTRFKFSNKFIDKVVFLVKNHMKPYDVKKMKKSTVRMLLAEEWIEELLTLCAADCVGKSKDSFGWLTFIREKQKEFDTPETLLPDPIIDGNDLITLGFKPGPIFKKILDSVRILQLEDELTDKEKVLEFVEENFCSER